MEKLAKIEVEMAKVKRNLSNLTSTVDEVVATCCKLGGLWSNSELELCQKIQNLLFPSGIFWDKENENYRTIDCNQALSIIQRISSSYKNKNEEKSENFSSNFKMCHIVPDYRTFIDDYLKILDFIEWLKVAYPEKAEFLTEKS